MDRRLLGAAGGDALRGAAARHEVGGGVLARAGGAAGGGGALGPQHPRRVDPIGTGGDDDGTVAEDGDERRGVVGLGEERLDLAAGPGVDGGGQGGGPGGGGV